MIVRVDGAVSLRVLLGSCHSWLAAVSYVAAAPVAAIRVVGRHSYCVAVAGIDCAAVVAAVRDEVVTAEVVNIDLAASLGEDSICSAHKASAVSAEVTGLRTLVLGEALALQMQRMGLSLISSILPVWEVWAEVLARRAAAVLLSAPAVLSRRRLSEPPGNRKACSYPKTLPTLPNTDDTLFPPLPHAAPVSLAYLDLVSHIQSAILSGTRAAPISVLGSHS